MKCHFKNCEEIADRGMKSCSGLHACKDGLCDILNCFIKNYAGLTCNKHERLRFKIGCAGRISKFGLIYDITKTNIYEANA